MTELPGTAWRDAAWGEGETLRHVPMAASWRPVGEVRHGFTHFELRLAIYAARVDRIEADGFRRPVSALDEEALPSVMRKCVRLAMAG